MDEPVETTLEEYVADLFPDALPHERQAYLELERQVRAVLDDTGDMDGYVVAPPLPTPCLPPEPAKQRKKKPKVKLKVLKALFDTKPKVVMGPSDPVPCIFDSSALDRLIKPTDTIPAPAVHMPELEPMEVWRTPSLPSIIQKSRPQTAEATQKSRPLPNRPKTAKKKTKKLVTKTSVVDIYQTDKSNASRIASLPLEYFDDDEYYETKSPQEWLQVGKALGGTPAFSRYHQVGADSLDWKWAECLVLDYRASDGHYLIQWPSKVEKWVPRFNLLFASEDRDRFFSRIEYATRSKQRILNEVEFDQTVLLHELKSMAPMEDSLKLGPLKRIGRNVNKRELKVMVK